MAGPKRKERASACVARESRPEGRAGARELRVRRAGHVRVPQGVARGAAEAVERLRGVAHEDNGRGAAPALLRLAERTPSTRAEERPGAFASSHDDFRAAPRARTASTTASMHSSRSCASSTSSTCGGGPVLRRGGTPAGAEPAGAGARQAAMAPEIASLPRVDFALQETATEALNEYVSAIASHGGYFESQDVARFIADRMDATRPPIAQPPDDDQGMPSRARDLA